MPNEINSGNWNIDSFYSSILGNTNASNLREFLFNNNLPDIPQEIKDFFPNATLNDRGTETIIGTKKLVDPGNVENWKEEGGYEIGVHEIRNIGMLTKNKYGPISIQGYNCPNMVPEFTGFLGYPTSAGSDFRATLVGKQLGFGIGAGIVFDSELQDIAQERRTEEIKSRVKQNFLDNTVGKINVDPLGLLAGQPLFQPDYTITKTTGIGGGVVNFLTDLVGVNVPTSIIPGGTDTGIGNDGFQTDLLKFTGGGQKRLLYDSININKYGPLIEDNSSETLPGSGISNTIKGANNLLKKLNSGDPPQKTTYLDKQPNITADQVHVTDIFNSLTEPTVRAAGTVVNKSIGDFVDSLLLKNEPTLTPIEDTESLDHTVTNKDLGFDTIETTYESEKSDSDRGHVSDYTTDLGPKRHITQDTYDFKPEMSDDQNKWFWADAKSRDGKRGARRGLLKFTQNMVNNQINKSDGAARFIGLPNSDQNYQFGSDGGKHKLMSMGNLVKSPNGEKDSYYCRSWSVRRAYHKYSDLIRHNGLWRDSQPGGENLSSFISLQSPGVPKIAWEYDGETEKAIVDEVRKNSGYVPKDKVIPYMLSIENLAWKGSPHYFKLPACERGPNNGRLMWFPPYDINFTDNTSVNWDATNFIGRAEPIYTYNNTERTGTLSFKVIVDHPSVLNKLRDELEINLESYFAGCDTDRAEGILKEAFKDFVTPNQVELSQDPEKIPQTDLQLPDITDNLFFYFKNAINTSTTEPCGVIGRCFDDSYEINPYSAIDNPNLYNMPKKASGELIPDGTTQDELVPYPSNNIPPCPGVTKWGPGGKNTNFCVDTVVKSFVTSDGFTGDTNVYGIQYTREGLNTSDFFGTSLNPGAPSNLKSIPGIGIDGLIDFLVKDPKGKGFTIVLRGGTSDAASNEYNTKLAEDRANAVKTYMLGKMNTLESGEVVKWEDEGFEPIPLYSEKSKSGDNGPNGRWDATEKDPITSDQDRDENFINNEFEVTPNRLHPEDEENFGVISRRRVRIFLRQNPALIQDVIDTAKQNQVEGIFDDEARKKRLADEAKKKVIQDAARNFVNECDYFSKIKDDQPFIYKSIREKIKNFHPAFHSMTPEGFNSRLTFLQQCGRQGPSFIDPLQPQNTAFGKPPVCILRVGDFYHTKIIIDTINFTFDPMQWDLNPEGIGIQPMVCTVDLNFKFIGGSSLQGPIRQLQNAVSYNFFANTSLYMGLEEIVSKRTGKGFLIEGQKDFDSEENVDSPTRSFWYGPFGSQTQADDASNKVQGQIQAEIDADLKEQADNKQAANEASDASMNEDTIESIGGVDSTGTEPDTIFTDDIGNSQTVNYPIKKTIVIGPTGQVTSEQPTGSIKIGTILFQKQYNTADAWSRVSPPPTYELTIENNSAVLVTITQNTTQTGTGLIITEGSLAGTTIEPGTKITISSSINREGVTPPSGPFELGKTIQFTAVNNGTPISGVYSYRVTGIISRQEILEDGTVFVKPDPPYFGPLWGPGSGN